jgi:hypothetical protein
MREEKERIMRARMLFLIPIVSVISAMAQVTVTLPSATGKQGDTVEVPIVTGDVSSSNIIAFQFTVGFNRFVVTALDVSTSGTLAGQADWTTYVNVLGDSIRVAGFGTTPLTGSGTLLRVKYRVEGSPGANTPLAFSTFIFNSGTPSTLLTNGVFKVLTSTGIDRYDVPGSFELLQNYPNPFNPNTVISYYLPQRSPVLVSVYNAQGKLIERLEEGQRESGYHTIIFDGTHLASGVYFYKIQAPGILRARSMLLLR